MAEKVTKKIEHWLILHAAVWAGTLFYFDLTTTTRAELTNYISDKWIERVCRVLPKEVLCPTIIISPF